MTFVQCCFVYFLNTLTYITKSNSRKICNKAGIVLPYIYRVKQYKLEFFIMIKCIVKPGPFYILIFRFIFQIELYFVLLELCMI